MTSEFKLPFEGCRENLSAKFKVKTTPVSERDCHSTKSSIQRRMSCTFEKCLPFFKDVKRHFQISKWSQANVKDRILNSSAMSKS